VDIVIGTIGKITSLITLKKLDLSQIRFFVLDEADKLLGNENISSIMDIFKFLPGGGSGENRLQVF
jgi:ATP-dependent RNA helicase DDX1